MTSIARPRAIVDRSELLRQVDAVAARRLGPDAFRAELLKIVRAALDHGRAEVMRRFYANQRGAEAARGLAHLMDQVIRVLHDATVSHVHVVSNPTTSERIGIIAVGGYGRAELAPFSDVDLLFLLPWKSTPHTEQVVEYLLYLLWDLGLKVGHSTRSVAECLRQAKADHTVRTALLEARWIWGDQALYGDLRRSYEQEIQSRDAIGFIEAKLAERDERHRRLGDSRYLLEPNLKEGKGGLRDLHTLFWIAKYAYRVDEVAALVDRSVLSPEEAQGFARAHDLLWTVRFYLHDIAGRPDERLTFDMQSEIGRRLGYTDHAGTRGVERFMKHYFLVAKDVGDLTRILCAALEAEHKKSAPPLLSRLGLRRRKVEGFTVEGGRLALTQPTMFQDDPVNLLRLFHAAQDTGLDIHPAALKQITRDLRLVDNRLRRDPEANRLFLEILASRKDPEHVLRRMSEVGLFGKFVPDFGRVVAQMQYDMYHVYTVDEHTIFALGILSRIERGQLKDDHPVASEVMPTVASRRSLYVALLLHDIAKGRGGDHSILGAEIALKLGPRFGLAPEETETVAWLVRFHLLMSNTAFKRDIDDPKTIQDFIAEVQSPERLKLLLALTVADIRAVGPKVWNSWKATLLRELYHRTAEAMSGGIGAQPKAARIAAARDRLRQALKDWDDDSFALFSDVIYPAYWLGLDVDTQARHARIIRSAEREGRALTVDTRVDPARGVTDVTIYTADHPGLFSRIAGALAVAGANIVDARIHTLANGMALDSFAVQDATGGTFDRPDRLARLAVMVEQSLDGRLSPTAELRRPVPFAPATRSLALAPRVLVDNSASTNHTVIEVNGRDRPGLLADLTRALTRQGVQIATARISTYGEKVVDVFYVKDVFGLKVEKEAKIKAIRTALLAVFGNAEAEGAAAAPRPVRPRRAAVG
ncbi:UTP--GlnB (protein PII) uridylyltransferase GlnD [Stella humosa]|uniref:Bifunctional uridylyltransferase/uridylyl-removing enzyme n=1 Tax=Stella humosa TaxID=94 RepID=A0A3N1LNP8_9PROT|nr:[protein-PII] uridylyltransferase [Stella humosa]ROP90845.1 UTP--GlnB (protein PII) uridylyltransferase GlnD [Stella humosa]BBK34807.1 bifunctional uridylyltransferase/uridylyl-removing enzyme [Stella humosa]